MKNRLKELRTLRKWSQSDLARALGISRQAVNGFESGKFTPSLEMAFNIARQFDVAIEEIFLYEDKNSMPKLLERLIQWLPGGERFTDKAIEAIEFARFEAAKLKKREVEPEDILMGLLADPTTKAALLLKANGLNLTVESGNLEERKNLPKISKLSSASKSILQFALESVKVKHGKHIDTEHVLFGLVKLAETGDSDVVKLFQQYEVDIQSLSNQLATEIA